jgi:hypothetical protein
MELYLMLGALILLLMVIAASLPRSQGTPDDYEELLAENRELRNELRQRRQASGHNGCLVLAVLVLAGIIVLALAPEVLAVIR